MPKFIRILIIAWLCSFGYITNAQSTTINALSCSQSDVQIAINKAFNGDTVIVPAGICEWTSDVILNKGIILKGGGIDQTIITNGKGTRYKGVLEVNNTTGTPFRITGFTFKGNPNINNQDILIDVFGTDKHWRIDHCKFTNGYSVRDSIYKISTAINVDGYTYGVIDHCIFDEAAREVIHVLDDGTSSWSRASSFGAAEAVYIEDCVFTHTRAAGAVHAILGQDGGRYVFRHNIVDDMNIDAHGYCGHAGGGTRHYEVYDNNFTVDSGQIQARWMYIRGGTGVIYNNSMVIAGAISSQLDLTDYRVEYGTTLCATTGGCCCEYPCKDQVGRGKDQISEPLYIWNNTIDGIAATIGIDDFGHPAGCDSICGKVQNMSYYIQEGRDFFNNVSKPGYVPYSYPHPITVAPSTPLDLKVIK